jgi:serine/threonine protein kinase
MSARRYSVAALDFARDEYPSELGALKVYDRRNRGPEAENEALGRLQREIGVLEQRRPGLLKILDSNESEGWIVTEYCHRGTLDKHLYRYKGNAKGALKSFCSLVETVAGLHLQKEPIVHRDIKPQNIFLGDTDELLLGDFGIVFLPNQPERLTVTGESVGPHDYMPPWALLGERLETIDPNFDVYMLGKVLWCMVAGRLKLPFQYHRDPRFDLTVLYPNDPAMNAINRILDKCIVERPELCLSSAHDLRLMVNAFLAMMERHGQLLNDDVPRPCRVCGVGYYKPEKPMTGQPNATVGLQLSRVADNVNEHIGVLRLQPFTCDKCKHVQFFRVGGI